MDTAASVEWICRKCHSLLSACLICGQPSQCGDVLCVEHTPDESWL